MAPPSVVTIKGKTSSRKLKLGSVFPSKIRRSRRLENVTAGPGATSPERLERELRAQKRIDAIMENLEETATIPDSNILHPDPSAPYLAGAEGGLIPGGAEGSASGGAGGQSIEQGLSTREGNETLEEEKNDDEDAEGRAQSSEQPSNQRLKLTLAETDTYIKAHGKRGAADDDYEPEDEVNENTLIDGTQPLRVNMPLEQPTWSQAVKTAALNIESSVDLLAGSRQASQMEQVQTNPMARMSTAKSPLVSTSTPRYSGEKKSIRFTGDLGTDKDDSVEHWTTANESTKLMDQGRSMGKSTTDQVMSLQGFLGLPKDGGREFKEVSTPKSALEVDKEREIEENSEGNTCQPCDSRKTQRGSNQCPPKGQLERRQEDSMINSFLNRTPVAESTRQVTKNIDEPIDEAAAAAKLMLQQLARISVVKRFREIQSFQGICNKANQDMIEAKRVRAHGLLNGLRKSNPQEFVDLGVEEVHNQIMQIGDYELEEMAEAFQVEWKAKIGVPYEDENYFNDHKMYSIARTLRVIHSMLIKDEMGDWLDGERDTALEDADEIPRLSGAVKRHEKLKMKVRIILSLVEIMAYSKGIRGPEIEIQEGEPGETNLFFHARPIWNLQNWLYLLRSLEVQPQASASSGGQTSSIRHVRQKVRGYCAILRDLTTGLKKVLNDFGRERNADIKEKVIALADLQSNACGESNFQSWQGQGYKLLGGQRRKALLADLDGWEKIILDTWRVAMGTPGLLEFTEGMEALFKPKAKHQAGSLRNVTQEGVYVSKRKPQSPPEPDLGFEAAQLLVQRANSRHTNTTAAGGGGGRKGGREPPERNSSANAGKKYPSRRNPPHDSGSGSDDRSRKRRPPDRRGGGGPPGGGPPDDPDDDNDEDESESDDSTESGTEEEPEGNRRGRQRERRRSGRHSRSVSFGRVANPPCHNCGSEKHETGSRRCRRNLDFCSYCNTTTHSFEECRKKNGAQCGACFQPAHSDAEECPVAKSEAYHRNLNHMYKDVQKMSWPQYQARIRLGSDVAGNLVKPEIKLPPSRLATHQKMIQDRDRQRAHSEMKLTRRIEESTALERTNLMIQANEVFDTAVARAVEMMKCKDQHEFRELYPRMHENLVAKNTEQFSTKMMKNMSGEAYKNLDAKGMGWGPEVTFSGLPGGKFTIEEFFKRFEINRLSNAWGDDVSAYIISTRLEGPAKVWYNNLVADEDTSLAASYYPNLKALMLNKYEEDLNVFVRAALMEEVDWDHVHYKGRVSSYFEDIVESSHKIFRGRPDHEMVSWKMVREKDVIDKFIRTMPTRLTEKMKEDNVHETVDGFRYWLERFEKIRSGSRKNPNNSKYRVHAVQQEGSAPEVRDSLMEYWTDGLVHENKEGPMLEIDAIRRNAGPGQTDDDRRCFRCDELGHIALNCPKRPKGDPTDLQTQAVARRRPTQTTTAANSGSRPRFRRKGLVPITRVRGSTRKSPLQRGKRYYSSTNNKNYQVNAVEAPESAEDYTCIGNLEDLDEDGRQVTEEFEHDLVALPEEDQPQIGVEAAAMRGPGRMPQGVEQLLTTKTAAEKDRSEVAALSREGGMNNEEVPDDPYAINFNALSYGSNQ